MHLRATTLRAIAALALGLFALPATAVVVPWTATLDQAQEVPAPVSVPGALGEATGTVDTDSGELSWSVSFAGLSGPAVGLHFHGPAEPGATAGVVVNVGNISGLGSPSAGSTLVSESQVAELISGLWYLNLHTELNRPGEIRGQVVAEQAVAEPAAAWLLLLGLGAATGAGIRGSNPDRFRD